MELWLNFMLLVELLRPVSCFKRQKMEVIVADFIVVDLGHGAPVRESGPKRVPRGSLVPWGSHMAYVAIGAVPVEI